LEATEFSTREARCGRGQQALGRPFRKDTWSDALPVLPSQRSSYLLAQFVQFTQLGNEMSRGVGDGDDTALNGTHLKTLPKEKQASIAKEEHYPALHIISQLHRRYEPIFLNCVQ